MMPNAKFLAGYWMLGENPEKGEDWRTAVGAHFVATSLADAVAICVREAVTPNPRHAPVISLVDRGMPESALQHEKL